MKKSIIALTILTLLAMIVPQVGIASSDATLMVTTFNASKVYPMDFDILVLDVTIDTSGNDQLNTFTVSSSGSARYFYDYTKVRLWADQGQAGFTGFGYDKELAEGVYENSQWVFKNLSFAFSDQQRFFVTIDTDNTLDDNKSLQISFLDPSDDGDGVQEGSERGVFLQSGHIATAPTPRYSTSITFEASRADILGPVASLNDIPLNTQTVPYTLVGTQSFILSGIAKDHHAGTITSVVLSINNIPYTATKVASDYTTWSLVYTPSSELEEATIIITAKDGNSNSWTGPAYNLIFDTRSAADQAEGDMEEENEDEEGQEEMDDVENDVIPQLIKGSLSAVYYLDSKGIRHVFVNDKVYQSWYGSDFSKVNTISDSSLAAIRLGSPVAFKPGTMIKAPSIPNVYVVDRSQTLRHLKDEDVARGLFGSDWNKKIYDLEESLLFSYEFSTAVNITSDIDLASFSSSQLTIDAEINS